VFSLVALAAAARRGHRGRGSSREILMSGNFVRDPLADALKVAIFVVTALAFVYSRGYLQARRLYRGEFYVLGCFAALA